MTTAKIARSLILISAFFLAGLDARALGPSASENLLLLLVGAIFLFALPLIFLIIFIILRIVTNKTIYAAGIYAGLGLPAVFLGLMYLESDGRGSDQLQLMLVFLFLLLIYLAIELMIKRRRKD